MPAVGFWQTPHQILGGPTLPGPGVDFGLRKKLAVDLEKFCVGLVEFAQNPYKSGATFLSKIKCGVKPQHMHNWGWQDI